MSDISSDIAGRSVTVTIKYGKDHGVPWAVFRGLPSEVREDIIAFFGIESASVSELTLADIVLNAAQTARALENAGSKLGAVSIGKGKGDAQYANSGPDEAQADPWATAAASAGEPPANPHKALYDAISASADLDSLKLLWAENQKAFTEDDELLAAWKAKGKEIKAAAQ